MIDAALVFVWAVWYEVCIGGFYRLRDSRFFHMVLIDNVSV